MEEDKIAILEKVQKILAEMYFKELKGSDLVEKVIIFQNFGNLVKNLKKPKLEAIGKPKPLTEEELKDDKPKKKKGKK